MRLKLLLFIFVGVLFFATFPSKAHAAISYVRANGSAGTSTTLDIGTAGTDRVVIVFADEESTGVSLTGVTVDSKACHIIVAADNPTGLGNHQEAWYCDEDDLGSSNGSVTVAITGGDAQWGIDAHLYTGANQNGYYDYGIDNTSTTTDTVTVNNISTPEDGMVIMGAGHGEFGTWDTWASPLTERTDSTNPNSTVFGTASGVETSAQVDKTYTAVASTADMLRATAIVVTWGDTTVTNPKEMRFYSSTSAAGTSTTLDIGTADTDRVVIVFADEESTGTSLTGVTVDSKACTLITVADNPATLGNHQEAWYCDEDDLGSSNGSVTVAITGGDAQWGIDAHTYIGAYQNGYYDYGIDNTSTTTDTVTVNNISSLDNAMIIMGAGHGNTGTWSTWASPLTERTDSTNPNSTVFGTASGIETTGQTNKTYTAVASIADMLRATAIVVSWPNADYVGVPGGDFTVSMWVNPTTSVTSKALATKKGEILLYTDGSGYPTCEYEDTDTTTYSVSATTALSLNIDTHITCTHNSSTLSLYVNGEQINTAESTTTVANSIHAWRIGSDEDSTYADLAGTVDEFRIYNRALSPREVSQLYNWAPGPSMHYKMDENTGTYAFDSSGNQNNGLLYNLSHRVFTKYDNSIPTASDTSGTNGRLPLGTGGTGDDDTLHKGSVIKDGDTYKMWYSGNDGTNYRIYYATSPDGLTWTKYDNTIPSASDTTTTNGRVALGTSGKGDDADVYAQTVIKDGDTYKMWYAGNDGTNARIYYATSPDGLTWTKYNNTAPSTSDSSGSNGQIPLGTTGKADDVHSYSPHVLKDGPTYKMWYAGYDGASYYVLFAISPDGLSWRKVNNAIPSDSDTVGDDGQIPLGTNTTGDDARTFMPSVLKDGNVYKMWYSGSDGTDFRQYYATATASDTNWVPGKYGSALDFDGLDDQIKLGSNAMNDVVDGAPAISLSAWVKPDSVAPIAYNNDIIVAKVHTGYWGASMNIEGTDGNKLLVGGQSRQPDTFQEARSTSAIPIGVWTHTLGILDFANDEIRVYVNGVLETTESVTFGSDVYIAGDDTTEDAIGAYYGYFDTAIDDVQVFNYALTPQTNHQRDERKASMGKWGGSAWRST